MVEMVKVKALRNAVRSTAQGMVVLNPDGPDDQKTPTVRKDVAERLELDGDVKIMQTVDVDPDADPDESDEAKKAREARDEARAADSQAEVNAPSVPLNSGADTINSTAYAPGVMDGMRDVPIDDEDEKPAAKKAGKKAAGDSNPE